MASTASQSLPPRTSSSTRFRFKSKSKGTHSTVSESAKPTKHQRRSEHGNHHHHHRTRRRHSPQSPLVAEQTSPTLSADAAFRESLFDALADDEGAAYWEGVYGQPIHTYSRYVPMHESDQDAGDNPVLERMSDDEYAAYVRTKMWEKSREHLMEERDRRRRLREEAKQNRRKRKSSPRPKQSGRKYIRVRIRPTMKSTGIMTKDKAAQSGGFGIRKPGKS